MVTHVFTKGRMQFGASPFLFHLLMTFATNICSFPFMCEVVLQFGEQLPRYAVARRTCTSIPFLLSFTKRKLQRQRKTSRLSVISTLSHCSKRTMLDVGQRVRPSALSSISSEWKMFSRRPRLSFSRVPTF